MIAVLLVLVWRAAETHVENVSQLMIHRIGRRLVRNWRRKNISSVSSNKSGSVFINGGYIVFRFVFACPGNVLKSRRALVLVLVGRTVWRAASLGSVQQLLMGWGWLGGWICWGGRGHSKCTGSILSWEKSGNVFTGTKVELVVRKRAWSKDQVWSLNYFFQVWFMQKKSLTCLDGKSMTPHWESLFHSVPANASLVLVSNPWGAFWAETAPFKGLQPWDAHCFLNFKAKRHCRARQARHNYPTALSRQTDANHVKTTFLHNHSWL